jgi:Fur family ferric uptake transcriptional regulator
VLIWETLAAGTDEHLSAEQVVERVQAQMPRLNPSTVYRNLELLVDEGLALRTDLGRDRAFYEAAGEHRHHHVVCERCGAIAHLHDHALGDLPARIMAASGYVLGQREISFFGVCSSCRGDR